MRVQREGSKTSGHFHFRTHFFSLSLSHSFFGLEDVRSLSLSHSFFFHAISLSPFSSLPSHLSFLSFLFYLEPRHLYSKRKCCIFRLKSVVRSSLILKACLNFVDELLIFTCIYVLSDVSGCFCFLFTQLAAHRRMNSVVLAEWWIKLDQLLNLTQI